MSLPGHSWLHFEVSYHLECEWISEIADRCPDGLNRSENLSHQRNSLIITCETKHVIIDHLRWWKTFYILDFIESHFRFHWVQTLFGCFSPIPPVWMGESERSAARISQTTIGSNHTSGVWQAGMRSWNKSNDIWQMENDRFKFRASECYRFIADIAPDPPPPHTAMSQFNILPIYHQLDSSDP